MTTSDRTPVGRLAEGPAFIPGSEARLRARLGERADQAGLVDVAFRTLDSPVGALLLAATPAGLVRVAFPIEDHDAVLNRIAAEISPRVLPTGRRLDRAVGQLEEYFAGQRRHFDLPLDLQLARGFRHTVLTHLREVGFGTTTSYSQLAAASGNPRAVRAAGSACAHNPIPVVVPCHRVVRSDGSIGQYRGGPAAKRLLLDLEAA